MNNDEVWTHHYGAFRLPSFCIGRRLSTLVFCGTTRVMCTNIRNAQSCCERLALADVDRCTLVKSEFTIMVHSDFIAVHRSMMDVNRWTSTNAQRCQVLSLWHRSAMKGDIKRCRKTSADVQQWKYERTIMVRSEFIELHRATSLDAKLLRRLCEIKHTERNMRKRLALSDVARCNAMNSNGAFRLLSLCIGRRLPTLAFCVATHVTRTNIRNAQSCCKRLASADVDRCSAMKSEWTINAP